jgi:mannose-6-phosphate isomerase-like protein (cupin superfamily)
MADVTVKRIEDFEAIFGGGFRRVRAGLGVTSFGLSVMEFPPNFEHYPTHDQTHDGQEEVYTVLSGRITLQVGEVRRAPPAQAGEKFELEPGVFARVGPGEKRKLSTGDEPARVLAMGATPGKVYEPPEFSVEGASAPPMHKPKAEAEAAKL